jgi:hypothetical protein
MLSIVYGFAGRDRDAAALPNLSCNASGAALLSGLRDLMRAKRC